jgi:hypothetical protein
MSSAEDVPASGVGPQFATITAQKQHENVNESRSSTTLLT